MLLDRAALLAWEHAEVAGVESPLHDLGLGLGVCLARGCAAQLLTVGRPTEQHADIDKQSVLNSPHPRQVTHRPAGR